MTEADILRQSANLLEERGHCKNALRDGQGRHCVLGAMIVVTSVDREAYPNVLRVRKHLQRTYGKAIDLVDRYVDRSYPFGFGAIHWNNDPKTTAKEVIDTLRVVANLAEENEDDSLISSKNNRYRRAGLVDGEVKEQVSTTFAVAAV